MSDQAGNQTRPAVILSAAKNLRLAPREMLRCAQNDSEAALGMTTGI